jgi:hypothetical protein
MCGGSVPTDNSGEIAAQQEATRQSNITAGTAAVNNAFSSSFTPDYYSGITNDYDSYYNPQLDQQYQNALNSLTYQLGQQGILQSSEGDRQLALLKQSYDTNKETVANNGLNAATTAKQNVATQQNALLGQAQQAGDPSALAAQAAETAAAIPSPVSYSPLGSVFSNLLGQGTNALSIQQGGVPVSGGGSATFVQPLSSPTSSNSSSSGSSHVVTSP